MKLAAFATTLMLICTSLHAAEIAGKVGNMSGVLVAQREGIIKVLGSQSEVQAGDLLITSKDSYAEVVLNDGGKMTLRPNSNLKIESYRFNKEQPSSDNALFSLLKGGFRAVTGLIGKRGDPDAYKVRAAAATIGVRGTDFSTRLCATSKCQDDKKTTDTPQAVGRVMLLQGELSAQEMNGKTRKLTLGASVFEGDKLITGASTHAVVHFRDESRVTLQANTQFFVEKFKYNPVTGEENAILRLFKGGVRVVTGLIGRLTHDNYQFRVANSTIGIRGTGFDAWCNGPCAEGAVDPGATQDNPLNGGGVYVWNGAVSLNSANQSILVAQKQAAIISRDNKPPQHIEQIPASVIDNPAPLPDNIPHEPIPDSGDNGAGVYVTVHDGKVIVAQGTNKLDLNRGETGIANTKELLRVPETPKFMKPETVPRSSNVNMKQGGCVVK